MQVPGAWPAVGPSSRSWAEPKSPRRPAHTLGVRVLEYPPRCSGPGSVVRIVFRSVASETLRRGTDQTRAEKLEQPFRTDPVKNDRTLWREREAQTGRAAGWGVERHPSEASDTLYCEGVSG